MKMTELVEKKSQKGTYSGVRFSKDTVKRIRAYIKENKIPNRIASKKLHTTVLFSRKYLPEYKPAGEYEEALVGTPKKFEKWLSQPDDETGERKSCLVLTYDCPELVKRHKDLMKEHNAEYDFDEYKPHITLSYDVGRDFDTKKLKPADVGNIDIVEEYIEELNLDWANTNA